MSSTLAERVKAVRIKRSLTIKQVAAAAEISENQYINVEQGRTVNPGIDTIRRIADALKVPPGWLAWGRETMGKLIDAENLKLAFIEEGQSSKRYKLGEFWELNFDELRKVIDSAPEAVVRCKDCEWWEKQKDSIQGRCPLMQMYPAGGWYCGNARRRRS